MIDEGKKPIMVMSGKSPYDEVHKKISQNMEQGYLDLRGITAENPELVQLEHILNIWLKNGLMRKGEVMYFQTQAGRFWQNNLTQSLLECCEYILSQGKIKEAKPMQGMDGKHVSA